jgi:citrate synthase
LRRGDPVYGFGHQLYPDGDPRGRLLVGLISETLAGEPAVERGLQIIDAGREMLGREPTLDFALVMLADAISAPAGFALGLMALGRTAGWVAHALEEYERDRLIRPRARYTGVMPGITSA